MAKSKLGPVPCVEGELGRIQFHLRPDLKSRMDLALPLDHVRLQRIFGIDRVIRYTQSAMINNAMKEYLESGKMGRAPTLCYENRRVTSVYPNVEVTDKFRRFYAQERRRQQAQYG